MRHGSLVQPLTATYRHTQTHTDHTPRAERERHTHTQRYKKTHKGTRGHGHTKTCLGHGHTQTYLVVCSSCVPNKSVPNVYVTCTWHLTCDVCVDQVWKDSVSVSVCTCLCVPRFCMYLTCDVCVDQVWKESVMASKWRSKRAFVLPSSALAFDCRTSCFS